MIILDGCRSFFPRHHPTRPSDSIPSGSAVIIVMTVELGPHPSAGRMNVVPSSRAWVKDVKFSTIFYGRHPLS